MVGNSPWMGLGSPPDSLGRQAEPYGGVLSSFQAGSGGLLWCSFSHHGPDGAVRRNLSATIRFCTMEEDSINQVLYIRCMGKTVQSAVESPP